MYAVTPFWSIAKQNGLKMSSSLSLWWNTLFWRKWKFAYNVPLINWNVEIFEQNYICLFQNESDRHSATGLGPWARLKSSAGQYPSNEACCRYHPNVPWPTLHVQNVDGSTGIDPLNNWMFSLKIILQNWGLSVFCQMGDVNSIDLEESHRNNLF